MTSTVAAYGLICIPTLLIVFVGIVFIVNGTRTLNAKMNPPVLTNNFTRVKEEYSRLKAQVDAHTLSEEQFKALLQELMFQDGQGRWWIIGYETGQWYISDGQTWTPSQPGPTADTLPKDSEAQKKEIQKARNLRLAGLILLVLSGVFATIATVVVSNLRYY